MFETWGLFGNGWTHESAKRIAGWRCKRVEAGLYVIGRPGKPGCVSVLMGSHSADIAIYDEATPFQIDSDLKAGISPQADNFETQSLPAPSGWFLKFIDGEGNLLP